MRVFNAAGKTLGVINDRRRQLLGDVGVLLLRIVFGSFMAIGHGWGKLSTFSEMAATFADPLGLGSVVSLTLAVFAEFFCSLAILVGLATRLALIPLMITMSVAAFIVHAADPFFRKELALVYLSVYVTLFLTGPGRYSLDALVFGRRQNRE